MIAALLLAAALAAPSPGSAAVIGEDRASGSREPRGLRGVLASTFSIVGRDTTTGDLGVAVCSKARAVGAVAAWARPGVGALAIQAWTAPGLGPRALDLLAEGLSPRDVLSSLLSSDDRPERRQIGVVDARGVSATHTGREVPAPADAREETDHCVQGNFLAGPEVLPAMQGSFVASRVEGLPLAERLLSALEAGAAAGGDLRGARSAALLVVTREGARPVDLRVDDHDRPVAELRRIHDAVLGRAGHRMLARPEGPDVREVQELLAAAGYHAGPASGVFDDATVGAVEAFRRAQGLPAGGAGAPQGLVDAALLAHLRAAAARRAAPAPQGRRDGP